jgi:archaeal type IV pilus assembly protein PilA
MKKIWNMRKDGKAVSPVIATILMVAITVVLAAVLYVMVMGFGGGNTQSTPTATMTYQKTGTAAGPPVTSTYTFTVAGVTRNDVKTTSTDLNVKISPAAGTVTTTFSTTLQAGDTIVVAGCVPNTAYTITVVYLATGGAVYQTTWTAT